MVGALNKLPVAASGILFFSDPATFSSVSSILLGFLAGLVYSAAKTAQKNREFAFTKSSPARRADLRELDRISRLAAQVAPRYPL